MIQILVMDLEETEARNDCAGETSSNLTDGASNPIHKEEKETRKRQ
jgi:hypothetical protein